MSIEDIKKTTVRPELVEGLRRLKTLFTFKKNLLTEDYFNVTLPDHSPAQKVALEQEQDIFEVRRGLIRLANRANEQLHGVSDDSPEYERKMTYLVELISIKRRLDQLIAAEAHHE